MGVEGPIYVGRESVSSSVALSRGSAHLALMGAAAVGRRREGWPGRRNRAPAPRQRRRPSS